MDPQWAPAEAPQSQEVLFYQNLFSLVDQNGVAPAEVASELFRKSGLAEPVLHAIWQLADINNLGYLDVNSFCTACRLIAHAQNGVLPSPEAAMQEPASLPFLDLSEPAVPHVEDPNAYLLPTSAPMAAPIPEQYIEPPSPQANPDYQKWFIDLDTDQDGFVTGDEVRAFFQESGLDDNALYEIWNQADQDLDGFLSFEEFTTACELVNVRLHGAPVETLGPPGGPVPESLPATAVFGLPQPVETPFQAPSGEQVENIELWGTGDDGANNFGAGFNLDDQVEEPTVPKSGSGVKTRKKKKGKSSGEGGGTDLSEGEKVEQTDEKKKQDKVTFLDDISFGDLVAEANETNAETSKKKHLETDSEDIYKSNRLDDASMSRLSASKSVLAQDDDPIVQVRKKLQLSVDVDYEDVRGLLLHIEKMKNIKEEEEKDLRQVLGRKEQFQKEIEELRFELEILKEERRHLDDTRIRAKKDCDSMAEMVSFYQREIDDMRKDIDNLVEHNEWLKSALLSTRQQTEAMQAARRTAVEEAQEEEEKIRTLEGQITELKVTAERTRREMEAKRSERLVLEQHLSDADQDRYLMVSGLEQQRAKLQRLQGERLARQEERQKQAENLVSVESRWPATHTNPQLVSQQPRIYRDKKGVPNASVYGSREAAEYRNRGLEQPPIVGNREQWETFSTDKPAGRRMGPGTDDEKGSKGSRLISASKLSDLGAF